MCSGVSKSGSPISRWMIERPAASSAFARANTSKAVSVPSTPIRSASPAPGPPPEAPGCGLPTVLPPWSMAPAPEALGALLPGPQIPFLLRRQGVDRDPFGAQLERRHLLVDLCRHRVDVRGERPAAPGAVVDRQRPVREAHVHHGPAEAPGGRAAE